MRFVALILLLLGIEFIAAGKPFDGNTSTSESAFLFAGAILLGIWHAIMWERGE